MSKPEKMIKIDLPARVAADIAEACGIYRLGSNLDVVSKACCVAVPSPFELWAEGQDPVLVCAVRNLIHAPEGSIIATWNRRLLEELLPAAAVRELLNRD